MTRYDPGREGASTRSLMSPTSDSTLANPQQIIADLRRANDELRQTLDERTQQRNEALHQRDEALQERDNALQRETATAEVLGTINSSAGDLGPVFDAMLEKAVRLCEAAYGTLVRYDGENIHTVALRNVPSELTDFLREPRRVRPGTSVDRLDRGERFIH